MWVWGEPVGGRDHTTKKRFRRWFNKQHKVARIEPTIWEVPRDKSLIIPRPKQMKLEPGWFVINPKTRIVYQNNAISKQCARQIQDEIRERWAIKLKTQVDRGNGKTGDKNSIYLGLPYMGGDAGKLAKKYQMKVARAKPGVQGYGLRSTSKRVIILGADESGLYWGVQSLMMALRWRNQKDEARSGLAIRCMKVLDWPETMERAVFSHKFFKSWFNLPFSEHERAIRLLRLFVRLKINVAYLGTGGGDPDWGPASPYIWPEGAFAKLAEEVRQKYHIELRPCIWMTIGDGGFSFSNIVRDADAWSLVEHNPDEVPKKMVKAFNFNPFKVMSHVLLQRECDRNLEQFAFPSSVFMGDFLYMEFKGASRWGVSAEFIKSGMSKEDAFRLFLNNFAGYLKDRGLRGVLSSAHFLSRKNDELSLTIPPLELSDLYFVDLSDSKGKDEEYKRLSRKIPFERRVNAHPSVLSYMKIAPNPGLCITQVLRNMSNSEQYTRWAGLDRSLTVCAEKFWFGTSDSKVKFGWPDIDMDMWLNEYWDQRDLPSCRRGDTPEFVRIDLRPFVNFSSHPTGKERMIAGYPPALDFRYMKSGVRTLGGVEFEVIDPAKNDDKSVLFIGRPIPNLIEELKNRILEKVTIPVNRKLASLAFLRTRWNSYRGKLDGDSWLKPSCRVV